MIVGVGNDIVDVRRIQGLWQKYPKRLPKRLLTMSERRSQVSTINAHHLAGRLAAKEALVKAIGCGLRFPLTFQHINVIKTLSGQPIFAFSDLAHDYLQNQQILYCHLSLSHDGDYILATVVVEGDR